jgi:hypothetical protein
MTAAGPWRSLTFIGQSEVVCATSRLAVTGTFVNGLSHPVQGCVGNKNGGHCSTVLRAQFVIAGEELSRHY